MVVFEFNENKIMLGNQEEIGSEAIYFSVDKIASV